VQAHKRKMANDRIIGHLKVYHVIKTSLRKIII